MIRHSIGRLIVIAAVGVLMMSAQPMAAANAKGAKPQDAKSHEVKPQDAKAHAEKPHDEKAADADHEPQAKKATGKRATAKRATKKGRDDEEEHEAPSGAEARAAARAKRAAERAEKARLASLNDPEAAAATGPVPLGDVTKRLMSAVASTPKARSRGASSPRSAAVAAPPLPRVAVRWPEERASITWVAPEERVFVNWPR